MAEFGKRDHASSPSALRQSLSPSRAPAQLFGDEEPEEQDQTALATLMIAAGTGTVFLLIAGAVIYLAMAYLPSGMSNLAFTGVADDGYVSPLDASCGRGWTKDMLNGKQLKCYLTTTPDRLCNKQERAHMVAILKRYDRDASTFYKKFAVATLGSIAAVQADGMKLGIASSKLQDEMKKDPLDPKTIEAAREVDSLASGILSGPNKLLESAKDNEPEYKLIEHVKNLLVKGYISKDDFGWSGVSLVKKAHRELVDEKISIRKTCG